MKKEYLGVFLCTLLVLSLAPLVSAENVSFLDRVNDFVFGFYRTITGLVVDEVNEVTEDPVEVGSEESVSEEPLVEESPEVEVIENPEEDSEVVEEVIVPPFPPSVEETVEEVNETEDVDPVNESVIEPLNETIEEINESVSEPINGSVGGETEESNWTEVEVELTDGEILSETTVQYGAVIGRPVKWVKKITVKTGDFLEVEIPKQAEDIVVKTGIEAERAGQDVDEEKMSVANSDRKELASNLISGNVVKSSERGFLSKLTSWLFLGITGKVVYEEALDLSLEEDSLKVDLSDIVESGEEDVAIEYYTEAPQAREEMIEGGKKVIVSGPSELGYTDILAYTLLEENLQVEEREIRKLKMYWNNEGIEEEIEFDYYDLDEDGKIDYLEWIVPHLSEQEYRIILMDIVFAGGTGTAEDPYQIEDCIQLQNISTNLSAHYILNNDIDCSDTINWNGGEGWLPIVDSRECLEVEMYACILYTPSFNGSLNGNGFEIEGLFLNRSSEFCKGLFGYFEGEIFNLSLIGSTIIGSCSGGIVGSQHGGSITSSSVEMTLTGSGGGVVGNQHGGAITNSHSILKATGSNIGGLVGGKYGGVINNSYSTLNATGSYLGGLVSTQYAGNISNSYSIIIATGSYIGGLVGVSQGLISNSYSSGEIFAEGGNVGGIIATANAGNLINSYSTVAIDGEGSLGGAISTVYGVLSLNNSFYDTNTSGQSDTGKGEPKTTEEMKDIATYSSWDIATSTEDLNNGYPYLGWQAGREDYVWLIYDSPTELVYDCGTLDQEGKTYILQNNLTTPWDCFTISADNVTLDLNGMTIIGPNDEWSALGKGVYVENYNYFTLKNGFLTGFGDPTAGFAGETISLVSSNFSRIENVTIYESAKVAIRGNSSGNEVTGSNITSIELEEGSSSNNEISGNSLSSFSCGGSNAKSNNIISRNTFDGTISLGSSCLSTNVSNNTFLEGSINLNSGSNIVAGNILENGQISLYGSGADNNLIVENRITNSLGQGVPITDVMSGYAAGPSGNILLNNYLTLLGEEVYSVKANNWINSTGNLLIYNSSFGEIRFFALSQDVQGNLTFGVGENIEIGDGFAYLDSTSLGGLDIPANITLYNNPYSNYPSEFIRILKDGELCTDCYNFTSLRASTVRFNVSGFSNYSIGLYNVSETEIPLKEGWNLISLSSSEDELSGGDVVVPLKTGWNLVGYSSENEEQHFSNVAEFEGESWSDAASEDRVQKYVSYYDDNASTYKFIGLPGHDTKMRNGKGYWVYAKEEGNLTLKGVGGASRGKSYPLKNLMFRNDTSGEIRNITQAVRAGLPEGIVSAGVSYKGWFGNCSMGGILGTTEFCDAYIHYWNASLGEGGSFIQIPYNFFASRNFSSWEGYFVNFNYEDISMILVE